MVAAYNFGVMRKRNGLRRSVTDNIASEWLRHRRHGVNNNVGMTLIMLKAWRQLNVSAYQTNKAAMTRQHRQRDRHSRSSASVGNIGLAVIFGVSNVDMSAMSSGAMSYFSSRNWSLIWRPRQWRRRHRVAACQYNVAARENNY